MATEDKCTKCEPSYYLTNGKCINSRIIVDDYCASNSQTVKNSFCDEAQKGFQLIDSPLSAVPSTFLANNNCAKINPNNGNCLQCAENSDGNGTTCNAPNTSRTNDCLQMMAGYFGNDMDNNCAKCRDSSGHYLDPNTNSCVARTDNSVNANCHEFFSGNNGCKVCDQGYYPNISTTFSDMCVDTSTFTTAFTVITGCEIYDSSDSTCSVCEEGRVLSGDMKTCTTNSVSVSNVFDINMQLTSAGTVTPVTNCSVYKQVDLDTFACVACESTYVKIVDLSPSGEMKYTLDLLDGSGTGGLALTVESCALQNKNLNTVNDSSSSFCEVGMNHGSGFGCLKCAEGYNGAVVELTKDLGGADLSSSIMAIGKCIPENKLQTTFSGIQNNVMMTPNQIPLSTYLKYTSCNDEIDSRVVFNSVVSLDGSIKLMVDDKNSRNVMACAVDTSKGNFGGNREIPIFQEMPNCQIYSFSNKEKFNLTNPDLCLACKPDHFPKYYLGTKNIKQCVKNNLCLNEGTILNGCTEPQFGYFLKSSSNMEMINYSNVLVSQGRVANCLLYSADQSLCLVCKKTYSLIEGSCVDISLDTTTHQCSSKGFGAHNLTLKSSKYTNLNLIGYTYFLEKHLDLSSHTGSTCDTCNSGYVKSLSSMNFGCVALAGISSDNQIDNCEKYSVTVPPKCATCASTHLLNVNTGNCLLKSNFNHCELLEGHFTSVCSKCEFGYATNESNQCVLSNCQRMLNGECTLCKNGFKIKGDSRKLCELNNDFTDTCEAYSPTNRTCGKCKSNNHQLYVFHMNQSPNSEDSVSFICEPLTSPLSTIGWNNTNVNETFLNITHGVVSSNISLELIKSDELVPLLYKNEDPNQSPSLNHAFPERNLGKCANGFDMKGFACLKCELGYAYNEEKMTCSSEGEVTHCDKYLSNSHCIICDEGYYLLSPTSCQPYTQGLNCVKFHPFFNTCYTCYNNLIEDDNACLVDPNCAELKDDSKECKTCQSGYQYNNLTKICESNLPDFCSKLIFGSKLCAECSALHWMDTSNNNECKPVTRVNNCAGYESESDACEFCDSQHYLSGQVCMDITQPVNNCSRYIVDGECVECTNLFDTATKTCFGGNVVGCEIYQDMDTCLKCDSEHYYQSSTSCKKYSDDLNCLKFNERNDRCDTCFTNFELNSLGRCIDQNTDENCLKKNVSNECEECKPDFILNLSTKECVARVAENCNEVQPNKDECKTCLTNFWLDSNDLNNCKPVTVVPKCVSYLTNEDACLACDSTSYLKDQTCEDVTSTINGCEVYSNDGVCSVCQNDFVKEGNFCDKGDVDNCDKHSSPTVCATCDPGHWLNSGRCPAYSSDLLCKDFNLTANSCLTCNDNFFLNQMTKCEMRDFNLHCLEFVSDQNKCVTCMDGYWYRSSDKTCNERTNTNCRTSSKTSDICLTCEVENYLNNLNQCKPVTDITGCVEYETNSDSCKTCESGRYWNGSLCTLIGSPEIQNCLYYSSPTTCSQCKDTYALNNNSCELGTINDCVVYTSTTVCKVCTDNTHYVNSSNQCSTYSNDLNCKDFDPNADECLTCEPNFDLNAENKCISIPVDSNCDVFKTGDVQKCETCKNGYFLNSSTEVCEKVTVDHCNLTSLVQNKCKECDELFYLKTDTECAPVTDVEFCIEYEKENDKCATCETTKKIMNGECLDQPIIITDCLTYNEDSTCKECEELKKLVNNKCVDGTIANCLKYDGSDCSTCESGYFLETSQKCTSYTDGLNCATFNSSKDECLTCLEDYNLTTLNKCETEETNVGCETPSSVSGQCSVCDENHLLNSVTKKCDLRTAQNCQTVKANTDECETCQTGFWMDASENDKCKDLTTVMGCAVYAQNENKCLSCESDRYMQVNLCFEVTDEVANCLFYQSNGYCKTCQSGFELDNGNCNSGAVENCKTYATSDTCSECKSGFFLQNSTTCSAYDENLDCLTYNPNENKCATCASGKTLNANGNCETDGTDPNCETFTSNTCTKCKTGYYLNTSANSCNQRNNNTCKTYENNADECATCDDNQYIDLNDSKKCKSRTVTDCIEYTDNTNTCVKCDVNKYLENNSCNTSTTLIDNCKYYSANGVCSQCNNSFFLENNDCKEGDVDNCATFDESQNCTKCNPTFYLKNPSECASYSDDLNCKEFALDKDECTSCTINWYLNVAKKCEPYATDMKCLDFHTSQNMCTSCRETEFLQSSNQHCVTRTAQFCLTVLSNLDQCNDCLPQYWKNSTVCQASTLVDNCAEYSSSSDNCQSCSMGFYLSGSTCVELSTSSRIPFCQVQTSTSNCQTCLMNFFKSSSSCSPGLIPHCQSFTNAQTCTECKDGYYLADSNKCDLYSTDLDCLTFDPSSDTCSTCTENKHVNNQGKCVTTTTDSNCQTYEGNTTLCKVCKTNYILDVQTKKCELRTAENCSTVEDMLDECVTCNTNFWKDANDLNKCKAVTLIQNCSAYQVNADACQSCSGNNFLEGNECKQVTSVVSNCETYSSATQCSACVSEYVLASATQCDQGTIDNCLTYTSANNCEICKDGFFKQNNTTCTAYTDDLNCSEFNPTANECTTCEDSKFLNAEGKCKQRTKTNCSTHSTSADECTSCDDDSYLKTEDNSCEPFTAVGCEVKDTHENKCLTCASQYFMNTKEQECKLYTPVDNCLSFYSDQDLCQFCNEGFYVDVSSNICRPNPDGIENCTEYSDLNKCSTCETAFFLSSNSCSPVTNEINNCVAYDGADSCSECQTSYFLESSTSCVATSIPNCSELLSLTSCRKCDPGYVMVRNGNDMKCQSSGISNCILAVGGSTPTCMKCSGDMIPSLDRESCVNPTSGANSGIAHCSIYFEVNSCQQCDTNYVRSTDCSSCQLNTSTNRIDSHCSSEVNMESMVCDSCQLGFHKDFSGNCVSCGGNGCAFCQGTTCVLCREGFYMNSSQKCILNSGTETEASVWIMSKMIMFVMFSIMILSV